MLTTVKRAIAHHQRRNQRRRFGATSSGAGSGASDGLCTIVGRLFSFVVTVVVVGTCLFVATRIAIGQAPEGDKPATPMPQRGRGDDPAPVRGDAEEPAIESVRQVRTTAAEPSAPTAKRGQHTSAWRRVRSVVLLAALLTVLGVILALVIAIFGALVLNGLRSAVQ